VQYHTAAAAAAAAAATTLHSNQQQMFAEHTLLSTPARAHPPIIPQPPSHHLLYLIEATQLLHLTGDALQTLQSNSHANAFFAALCCHLQTMSNQVAAPCICSIHRIISNGLLCTALPCPALCSAMLFSGQACEVLARAMKEWERRPGERAGFTESQEIAWPSSPKDVSRR